MKDIGKKIEEAVTESYKKIENGVVDGYTKVEESVVEGYSKVEEKFIGAFLTREGETPQQARERLKNKLDQEEK